MKEVVKKSHPEGEKQRFSSGQITSNVAVDTYGGRVHIDWDHNTPITPYGQLSFFIEFLKRTELFDRYVEDCPLVLTSPNAPSNRDILGTILLSVLSGHTRYSHITAVRTDKVNPSLLGMKKLVSEDSVRRGLQKVDSNLGKAWLTKALLHSYSELLMTPWILDVDTTIKCLYGHQEGAVVGYNPKKPGRPSHTYHTYMIANIRLVLDVEVLAGNESNASHTLPHLFSWLDELPPHKRPAFIRGDCGFGTDSVMSACEERQEFYLFKLKQTRNVKRFISEKMLDGGWVSVGQGWQSSEGFIQLSGWKVARRVVALRRKITKNIGVVNNALPNGQLEFDFATVDNNVEAYEYAMLVTNLESEMLTLASHYRDRADSENNFDELKNQWGWAGYTTHDLHRCQLMARIIALTYNWWTLFVRLIEPEQHTEAITSRPLLLHAVGKQIRHAGQTIIQVNSNHAKFKRLQVALTELAKFFKTLKPCAEQLTMTEKMQRVFYRAFNKFIEAPQKDPPTLLLAPN